MTQTGMRTRSILVDVTIPFYNAVKEDDFPTRPTTPPPKNEAILPPALKRYWKEGRSGLRREPHITEHANVHNILRMV
jgi:hypothetical protein